MNVCFVQIYIRASVLFDFHLFVFLCYFLRTNPIKCAEICVTAFFVALLKKEWQVNWLTKSLLGRQYSFSNCILIFYVLRYALIFENILLIQFNQTAYAPQNIFFLLNIFHYTSFNLRMPFLHLVKIKPNQNFAYQRSF